MLKGERLALREWREADVATIAALRNDIELQSLLMTRARPNPAERVRQWLAERASRTDMLFFVIASNADDSVLGYVQVASIDAFQGTGELGICLRREAQGQGIADECCALLEGYAGRTLGLRKFTLRVLASNARAVAFYRRRGYREIGRLERHYPSEGEYEDVILMERFLPR